MTPGDQNLNSSEISSKQTFWPIFRPQESPQGISVTEHSDLVYDPGDPNSNQSSKQTFWPIFKTIEQEMLHLDRPLGIL